jgi:hypothetical protein
MTPALVLATPRASRGPGRIATVHIGAQSEGRDTMMQHPWGEAYVLLSRVLLCFASLHWQVVAAAIRR